jgi:hypothetical protein
VRRGPGEEGAHQDLIAVGSALLIKGREFCGMPVKT